ncbi:alpha/beta hydrolase [Shouchella patagoniensis]|uniref:alpha/beta hydrolase n=1 Tax=Shouchella patagoniensis TaxID=228576 RepID=UPI000995706D|nr:alpha/beta hydrolase [Shouchella patagoniensis]
MRRKDGFFRLKMSLKWIAFLSGLFISMIVLAFAGSPLLIGTGSDFVQLGTKSWSIIGPHLVLFSCVAVVLTLVCVKKIKRPLAYTAIGLSFIALISSTWITGSIGKTIEGDDGLENPFTTFVPTSTKPIEPDRTEMYQGADGQELEALVYEPATRTEEDAPVMMYIHGGGWISGEPANWGSNARWYAERGWVVVSVEYELATEENATWNKAPEDVACGLAWTKKNASEWGGDEEQLVVIGESSGGNLAVNLAWSAALDEEPSECAIYGTAPEPQAVVASYPVINPSYTYENGNEMQGLNPQEFTEAYIGGTPNEHPDRIAAIDSSEYASPSAPPTLILEAEKDDIVPVKGVSEAAEEAQEQGVDLTRKTFPYSHHGFDSYPGSLGNVASKSVVVNYLENLGLSPG